MAPGCLLRDGECSSDSYIGRGDFFLESLKICSGSSLLDRGLTFDLFLSSVHFCVKRRANSTIE